MQIYSRSVVCAGLLNEGTLSSPLYKNKNLLSYHISYCSSCWNIDFGIQDIFSYELKYILLKTKLKKKENQEEEQKRSNLRKKKHHFANTSTFDNDREQKTIQKCACNPSNAPFFFICQESCKFPNAVITRSTLPEKVQNFFRDFPSLKTLQFSFTLYPLFIQM